MSKDSSTTEETLESWTERDLSALAKRGELRPAFCVDDKLLQLDDIVMSGKAAILVGESGVGKSATVYELVRRLHLPNEESAQFPPLRLLDKLAGRRVLQFSLRRRAAGLRQPHTQMGEEVLRLVDALVSTREPLALFFRDLDLAYQFNLETQFENLAFKFDGPIIGEGTRSTVQNMLEFHPELDQHFVTMIVEEPTLDEMHTLLHKWSKHNNVERGISFEDTALEHALYLSHRFLSRSRMPRKALDLIEQVAVTARQKEIKASEVINRFCDSHRVPRGLVDPDIALDLDELRSYFGDRVLGQADAVSAIVDVIGLIKSGMSDTRRPFGVFLFVGPTGVGKTHLAQLLAKYLFGNKERLIRVNMSDYSESGKAEVLFGNPNGATPSSTRGVLAQRVSGHPFAVLLLDEFEKAHSSVHDRLLQLMDEGSFINGGGESVSCRSMIIIATSNTGAEVYRSEGFGFAPKDLDMESKDAELSRRLRETFRFEFLNRFDRIVHFHPLSQADIRTIALREFELIKRRAGFSQRKLELTIDECLVDWISVLGYHPDFGARFLRRTIEAHVATAIATAIVRETPSIGATLKATVRLGKVVAYVSSELADPPILPPAPFVSQPLEIVSHLDDESMESLRQRADTLLQDSSSVFEDLRAKRSERKSLLAKMDQSSCWEHQAKRVEVLDRFREIEVILRSEVRATEAIERLREERDSKEDSAHGRWRLQHRLDGADTALADWHTRQAERHHHVLWMMISSSGAQLPDEIFVHKLTELQLAWSRRLGLEANVVAYTLESEKISRTFLAIEGVGAKAFLSMEEGIHRFARKTSDGLQCEIEIWEQQQLTTDSQRLRSSRGRKKVFELSVDSKSSVKLSDTTSATILGQRSPQLLQLVAALDHRCHHTPSLANVVVRLYGQNDDGVRDPRTGVTMPRTKDVFAGNLDRFLEAWRHVL